jgi:ferredoxin-like protein FixX
MHKRDILTGSNAVVPDRKVTFDKVTSVHYSGTHHEEDQPVHLLVHTEVCHSVCGEEFGHPCVRFCPANVYEMVDNGQGGRRLQINASNCVLQDVRHHGSLRCHHLGGAGGRGRAANATECERATAEDQAVASSRSRAAQLLLHEAQQILTILVGGHALRASSRRQQ